jgi:serine/threonine protein kinase/tetratricopeptide (TPR) repeat protein
MWSLFHAALELPPDRRSAFLGAECPEDEALRREVAELLASHDQASGALDHSPAEGLQEATPGSDPLRGGRIGAYRILDRIGEGGMGVVYDAEQESPVRRRVALKVIHLGMHKDAAARFTRERQALAVMAHPHIARIFDGGVLPDGRPFMVLEHVDGVPLHEYCDHHALDVTARLQLLISVCEAVQHAHQKGVIHRDLKPSNVLVATSDGRAAPKVIDFGVAKAIDGDTGSEAPRTRLELLVGTLEYMSPEQLEPGGLDVDTRSDIYSLGVVLYELLAGVLPFDWPALRRAGLPELRRAAREREPPRPSRRFRALPPDRADEIARRRRTTPAALARRLSGDLDWIVQKALERDRTRRYATASELAADLRRHLAHEPVQAGPPSARYRLAKLVRRHRVAVATAAGVAVLLTAFAVSTTLQSLEIRRALSRADRERARAERVSRFLEGVFRASDPFANRRDLTAREVLDQGAARVSRELAEEPDVQAAVMTAVGRVYGQLGVHDSAERMHREALAIRQRLHAGDHPELAESLEELGQVLHQRASYPAAATLLEQAKEMQGRLFGDADPRRARGLYLLGSLRRSEGKLTQAEGLLGEALRLTATDPPAHGAGAADLSRAAILEELGSVALKKGDFTTAELRLREALAARRREHTSDSPRAASTLVRIGTLLQERGELEAAEPLFREALALLERHLGPDHEGLAPALNNLALLLQSRGRYEEAEPLYRRSLAISRRLHGERHPAVAIDLNNLGLLRHDQGRLDEASRFFKGALAIQREVLGSRHADLAYPTTNLARVLQDERRFAEAETLYRRGLSLRRELLPERHPALADSLAWLGKLLSDRGDPVGGETLLREAASLRAAAFAADDWRTAEARSLLGGCLTAQARYPEAEALLTESYPVLARKRGRSWKRTRDAAGRIVALYEAWGRPEQAARAKVALE